MDGESKLNKIPIKPLRYIKGWKDYSKRLCLVLLVFVILRPAFSQEYFQQEVNYTIQVTLNDKTNELSAFENIQYLNNSPDTLNLIFFHLWPNAYSSNNTDLAKQLQGWDGKERLFEDPELNGYIDSLNFNVDNRSVSYNLLPEQPDICKLSLNEALLPGDTIIITTPFHVKIPKGVTSRLGHIGESYQISQWYPKPAVYDRTGWHQMPYLDQGEFYSEFGSFDVSITLPSNYTIGATGDLQNIEEKERLLSIAADTSWINNPSANNDNFPASSGILKTLHYKSADIHDFAWFADKRFHVLNSSITLPESGKEVTTWVMFTNTQSNLWEHAIDYVNSSITFFSEMVGDYPYNSFTAVQSALNAGVGMEYPGITVIGIADDAYSLNQVITHEICHNWFYSALGSDERRFPFMDESITSMYEQLYINNRYPEKKMWELLFEKRELAVFMKVDQMPAKRITELEWLIQAHQNLEQPLNLAAPDYSNTNYGTGIYSKASIGFNYLRAYLGDSVFDNAMHVYYSKWKSKHPGPDDLRNTLETSSGHNLGWFFDDFMGTTKRIDYKIVRLKSQQVLIRNKGGLVSPFIISGVKSDSILNEVWVEGFSGSKWISIPHGNYPELFIDPDHIMPEYSRLNNNIRTSGIFPKSDPLRLQLLFTIEDPGKRSLIYLPLVNWNFQNGFMAGVAFNNGFLLTKPIEYFVMPFFTFRDNGLAGSGRFAINITPFNKPIRLATISIEGTRFGAPYNKDFHKLKAGIDILFRTKKMNNPLTHRIYTYLIAASDLTKIESGEKANMLLYMQLGYILAKKGKINPYSFSASIELNHGFQKISGEFNYRLSYIGENRGLDIRIFGGKMLIDNPSAPLYSFSPSGRNGCEQYLYQGTYINRFGVNQNTFGSRQADFSEGALVSPINNTLGYSNWLVSLSLTSNFPGFAGKMPVKPFLNFLLNDHGSETTNDSPVFYEAGFKAGFWNFFEIYVPVLVSGNIESITGPFKSRIRFILKLDSFKQFKLNKGSAS